VVVTPVSSNSAVDLCDSFKQVIRTRIGSPYVIEAMNAAITGNNTVVGYEANGGFLTATPIIQHAKTLSPLATRDAAIVPLAILLLAAREQKTIAQLLQALPPRYTASDRLKEFPSELSRAILGKMQQADTQANLQQVVDLFSDIS
jgi:phosphomannomutase